MKTRAIRRHHEERIKNRVEKYYGGVFQKDAREIGKMAHARTPCSCFMCGNPRKWFKQMTLRERRAPEIKVSFREALH